MLKKLQIVKNESMQIKNLNEYINEGKEMFALYTFSFGWADVKWRGFGTFKTSSRDKGIKLRRELDFKFCDFAKAILIHKHMLNPSKSYSALVAALRLVEVSLTKICGIAEVRLINRRVFEHAFEVAKRTYKPTTAFNISEKLEKISTIIFKYGFSSKLKMTWTNPVKAPKPELYQGFEELISEGGKLSGLKSIEALAAIFAKDDSLLSDQDKFTTSVFALLMCAPSRITEILSLPFNCEFHAVDSKGIERFGLRLFSLKGYGANIKWIPTIMAPVAKKAVSRLIGLSENARNLASCINCSNFIGNDIPFKNRLSKGLTPEYKNALCLQEKYALSEFRKTSSNIFRICNASEFNRDISSDNKKNIFARHGFFDSDNQPLSVNTHQARHFLNTIAHLGGMTNFDIARWSGRKNVSQNNNYNHISREHLMDYMCTLPGDSLTCDSSFKDKVSEPEPDFSQTHGAYLITDCGYCEHDYSISPCEKYPGFDEKNKQLKEKFDNLVKTSDKDSKSGVYGADKWADKELIFKTNKI